MSKLFSCGSSKKVEEEVVFDIVVSKISILYYNYNMTIVKMLENGQFLPIPTILQKKLGRSISFATKLHWNLVYFSRRIY